MAKRIVIIEDDKELGQLLQEILLDAISFPIELIVDGQQAMDYLETTTPDTIILDLHLPYVSGLAILAHVRASDRLKDIKVYVISADRASVEKSRSQANETFLKPIDIDTIEQIITLIETE